MASRSHVVLFVFQWSLAFFGIVGNLWVILAISRYNAIKKTSNKILFINLAIADLGVLVIRNAFYFLSISTHDEWHPSEIACKLFLPLSYMFMPASVLTLAVIWYSRCKAIVNIRQLNEICIRSAWLSVTAIWLFVILFYPAIEVPMRRVSPTSHKCELNVSESVSNILYAIEDSYFLIAFIAIIVWFVRMRHVLIGFSKVLNNDIIVKR